MINIIELLSIVIALVIAVTFHEAAHGFAAYALGDSTAKDQGRLTFNPLPHIDPIGSLLLPGALLLAGTPFLFGYAKPVPVNFSRLKYEKWGVVLVTAAGPLTNLALAIVSALLLHINAGANTFGNDVLVHSLTLNLVIMIFNLFPVLPFAGGRVVHALSPKPVQKIMESITPYTSLIFLVLIGLPLLTEKLLGYAFDPLKTAVLYPYFKLLEGVLTLTGHG